MIAHLNQILLNAPQTKNSIKQLVETYGPKEIQILRTSSDFTGDLFDKLIENVFWTAGFLFRDHPKIQEWPEIQTLGNRYIFRVAVCEEK